VALNGSRCTHQIAGGNFNPVRGSLAKIWCEARNQLQRENKTGSKDRPAATQIQPVERSQKPRGEKLRRGAELLHDQKNLSTRTEKNDEGT
jgi:hypothetical protein